MSRAFYHLTTRNHSPCEEELYGGKLKLVHSSRGISLTVCAPSTQGPLTLTVFSFMFLSLITANSITESPRKSRLYFTLFSCRKSLGRKDLSGAPGAADLKLSSEKGLERRAVFQAKRSRVVTITTRNRNRHHRCRNSRNPHPCRIRHWPTRPRPLPRRS